MLRLSCLPLLCLSATAEAHAGEHGGSWFVGLWHLLSDPYHLLLGVGVLFFGLCLAYCFLAENRVR